MSLLKTWAPYFRGSVRMQGRAYQQQGRVRQVAPHQGEWVRAEVEGSRTYEVTLTGDADAPVAHCNCAVFASGQYCKHLYATLLDVQTNGVTGGDDDSPEATAPVPEEAWASGAPPAPPKARRRDPQRERPVSAEPEWMGRLSLLRPPMMGLHDTTSALPLQMRQVCYVISGELSRRHHALVIELYQRLPARSGWSSLRRLRISAEGLNDLIDPLDRELCALILGASWVSGVDVSLYSDDKAHAVYRILPGARHTMLARLAGTGRCYLDDSEEGERPSEQPRPLVWENQSPWVLWMVGQDAGDQGLEISVELRRDRAHMAIDEPSLILGGDNGVVFHGDRAAPFDDRDAYRWVTQFRDDAIDHGAVRPLLVPKADMASFLDRLYLLPHLPEIDLPIGVGRAERHMPPVPHLELYSPTLGGPVDVSDRGRGLDAAGPGGGGGARNLLAGRLWFAYGDYRIKPGAPGRFVASTPGSEVAAIPVEGQDAGESGEDAGEKSEDTSEEGSATAEVVDEAYDEVEMIRRDRRREEEALSLLVSLGFRADPESSGDDALAGVLPLKQMPQAVNTLLARGWDVSADRKVIRQAGTPSFSITSGIDWFELHGGVRFSGDGGDQVVQLPEILAALRQGRSMVTLGDGSQGLLPEEWLDAHGLLWNVGKIEGDHLRFKATQAAVLDALLDSQELVDVDAKFAQVRQRLHEFDGVKPLDAPASFVGSLRPYQREGLGWLAFLRWFGTGGILADDMGLGKTIQVLAMLAEAYETKVSPGTTPGNGAGEIPATLEDSHGRAWPQNPKSEIRNPQFPTLVVAPRSVVFNWIDEAQHFTPNLRVLSYHGAEREALRQAFDQYDLVVTSYGLMRRDVDELRKTPFHYVVLDEAQAIKNPGSQVAKAARLLQAQHRLALTGTPVENHLGDLWSIFEYLNPGMLGSSTHFSQLVKNAVQEARGSRSNGHEAPAPVEAEAPAGDDAPVLGPRLLQSTEVAGQLGRALRPFVLRRTKKQVLADLPEKTEQTILCEMEPPQRQVYDQLLRHYRGTLLAQASPTGGGGSMLVLEALLRLRQAACHPGLIDPKRVGDPSAKLEALLEDLTELIDEGHKALVFSQFTSFLAIVRQRLDAAGIVYEYLDGQTRHRKQRVQRFQNDPDCPLFLISLKAGGLGLNLTAAEYVFILDPWWNPAVENQAIDRAHRIGQTRHVFAYRMICQDTVEQRIAELQERKRHLADAIIGEQPESLLQALTREDLERLLS
ncbi:MAG: SNF2-related protein [Phycisphaeraceae bacterium]